MISRKELSDLINAGLPGTVPSNIKTGEFTAMIFRERDYPDGDDVCRMLLKCIGRFTCDDAQGRLFVVSEEGEIYSLTPVSESAGILYAENAVLAGR